MNEVTSDRVRQFLLTKYAAAIDAQGVSSAEIPDNFDFLLTGVVDSFGILEMVGAIEDEFQIQLDMATLDAEQMTLLGPLSRYVAETAARGV